MPQIPLFPIRTFTFTSVQGSQSLTIPVIRAFDVSMWREATLLVRVHSRTIPVGGTLAVQLISTLPSRDDPSNTFNASSAAGTVSVTSTSPPSPPALLTQALSSNFGSMLALNVVGTQPAATSTFTATLSAVLSVKA